MPFEFCNVDLNIRSEIPLTAITEHFASYGDRVLTLYSGQTTPGKYLASFDIHWDEALYPYDSDGNATGPERWGAQEMIEAFCELLEHLPVEAHKQWTSAISREFDLGYEADDHCPPLKVTITSDTLKRVLAIGAELGFTVYPKCFGDPQSTIEEKPTGDSNLAD